MQTEIKKRIEDASRAFDNLDFRNAVRSDCFKAGAKFILELPELKEAVEALKVYAEGDWSIEYGVENWLIQDDFGTTSRKALSKLRDLGIVKEGE